MIRRMLVGLAALLLGLTTLTLLGPAAYAVKYNGPVDVNCQRVSFPNAVTFDRDNTGNGRETVRVQAVDANGVTLLDQVINAPLAASSTPLGVFSFKTQPTRNPITIQLVSAAGNGLTQRIDLSVQRNCDKTPEAFVKAAYSDLIGRLPNASELEADAMVARNPSGRLQVADRLVRSSNHVARLVNRLYIDTLGRPGDSQGINYWVAQIQQGTRSLSLVSASFYASDEYFRGFGGNTNDGWVRDLYVKLLRRSPDDAGVQYWVDQARRTRTPVALDFFQSPESKRARISALYEQLLGRAPADVAVSVQSARLASGSDLDVEVYLVASSEYAQRAVLRFPSIG